MHRASLLFRGLAIVAFVTALAANCARAQTSQPRDSPAYGQQRPQGDDQNATSQGSDDSREDNPSAARPEQDDSSGGTDSDQNNNDRNDSDSSEQEKQKSRPSPKNLARSLSNIGKLLVAPMEGTGFRKAGDPRPPQVPQKLAAQPQDGSES